MQGGASKVGEGAGGRQGRAPASRVSGTERMHSLAPVRGGQWGALILGLGKRR